MLNSERTSLSFLPGIELRRNRQV